MKEVNSHDELLAAFNQGKRITAQAPATVDLPMFEFDVYRVDKDFVYVRSGWGGSAQLKANALGLRYIVSEVTGDLPAKTPAKDWAFRALPPKVHTVAVLIGNSDDKLSQAEWAQFVRSVLDTVCGSADKVHFEGHTPQASPRQSVAVVFEISTDKRHQLQRDLKDIKREFRQDFIAWV